MNAIHGFLGTVAIVAWVYMCAMFLVAALLAVFDRPRKYDAVEDAPPSDERRAA